MVDVVSHAATVTDRHQCLQHFHDIFTVQHTTAGHFFATEAAVELHPAHRGQVVAIRGEEQVLEQVLCRLLGRRLAGTHHAVDFDQRFQFVARGIQAQRVGHVGTAIQLIGVESVDVVDAHLRQAGEDLIVQLGVAFHHHFAGFLVDDVLRQRTAVEVFARNLEFGNFSLLQLANMARGDAAALLDNDLAAHLDIEGRHITTQTRRDQRHLVVAVLVDGEGVHLVEHVEDFFRLVTQRAQQNRGRQLAPAVDTHEYHVLGVELEVQPGATVGNDTR